MTIAAPSPITTAPIATGSSARAEFDVAVMLREDGRLDEARVAFEGLLTAHPNHLGLIGNIGIIAWEQGDLPNALEYLARAVTLDPRNPLRLRHLGTVLLHTKTYELAAETFGCAVALDPDDTLAHHGLGVALRNLERWDEAEAALRTALKARPDAAGRARRACPCPSRARRVRRGGGAPRRGASPRPRSMQRLAQSRQPHDEMQSAG